MEKQEGSLKCAEDLSLKWRREIYARVEQIAQ